MLSRTAMHSYCSLNVVYDSNYTVPLEFVLNDKGVPDIGFSALTLAMRMTSFCFPTSTGSPLPSVYFMFLVVVRISTSVPYTVSIGMGCEL